MACSGITVFDAINGDNTHTSTVFRAEVIPHNLAVDIPQWALIKAASPDVPHSLENLERELQSYLLPGVASAACYRKLYETIRDPTDGSEKYVTMEWFDTTLAAVKYQPNMRIYALIKTFLRAALESRVVLEKQNHVNTDFKPANILLAGLGCAEITAKVGDLGLVFPAGQRYNAQPYAMRAPEVFVGQPCTEPSQVWAVAAMLLCWIKAGVMGQWDSPHWLIDDAWCMAKIKRLFPDWKIPTPDEFERKSSKF
ncbi:hypothetical protein K402DRAFT_126811 [Aulographum hederae CBS 113979]|uniref:Protein kinase domain-containing protein n=1 Tax=Aulographum hederae CBS 113979 TaxID=1176131 RepID=A0A6G1HEZ6_9PEZI|nr:hypothetical protein K402DRAFT_126811 [Aulographum hederae CBS 113979]